MGSPIAVVPSRSFSVPVGDMTRSSLATNGGFDSDTGWTKGSAWTIASGVASHASGSADSLSQTSATAAGTYYRLAFTLSAVAAGQLTPQLTGGTTQSGSTRSANGDFSDRIQAVPGNDTLGFAASTAFIGSIDNVMIFEETTTCLAAGVHYFWLEPQNRDGVAGPLAGPFTVSIR